MPHSRLDDVLCLALSICATLAVACEGSASYQVPEPDARSVDAGVGRDMSLPADAGRLDSGPEDEPADMASDASAVSIRDARVSVIDLPSRLECGATARGTITFENTGETTWSVDEGYRLRAIRENPLAVSGDVAIGEGERVAPCAPAPSACRSAAASSASSGPEAARAA